MDYKELKNLAKSNQNDFEKVCLNYLCQMKFISVDFFGKLYRGRLFDQSQTISNVAEISYIPNDEWVKGYGRANRIGQSIFYCAESFSTIFFETMLIRDGKPPTERERMVFVEWITKEPLKLVIIIQPEINKRKGFFELEYGNNYDNLVKNNAEAMIAMEFLYEVYTERARENSDYILPSFISNFLYKSYDGILYPSSPFTNGGYNIAITPKIKDEKLMINKVVMNTFKWEAKSEKEINDNSELIEAKAIDKPTGKVFW
jgi:RES domain-containing protein